MKSRVHPHAHLHREAVSTLLMLKLSMRLPIFLIAALACLALQGAVFAQSSFVTTLAGSGSPGNEPKGVAVDGSGNVYVAGYNNHLIRKITASGTVTTLAGSGIAGSTNGKGTSASFYAPNGVAVDGSANVYVADSLNHRVRKIAANGTVTTLAGSGIAGSTNGNGTSASFRIPSGVAVDGSGNVYVADTSNHLIRKITANGTVTTLAGSGIAGSTNGNGTSASFNRPNGVAVDGSGNVYVADTNNHRIRKITANGTVTTLAGSGIFGSTNGDGTSARFGYPNGVAVHGSWNVVYVADSANLLIRKILIDTDTDGLSDEDEVKTTGTDPQKADTDEDGLSDGAEVNVTGSDLKKADTDGDDLSDGVEVNTTETDPKKSDTDGDGLSDGAEVNTSGTDPKKSDTDGDGFSDGIEVDATGSDPKKADTDGDGLSDEAEVNTSVTDPKKADTDWDGLSDGLEVNTTGTDPKKADTDGDGLSDELEVNTTGSDPKKVDTDGDGLSDEAEFNTTGSDPKKVDTDGDGLSDEAEFKTTGTDPKKADTDGDGYSDSFEISNIKSSPLASNDVPAFTPVRDPKNPDEDNAGYDVENAGVGYVGQEYEIGITEISNLMYARFLNATAKNDTLYGLYNTNMGTDASGGIVRSGANGNYSYTVKNGFENRPVNFVSVYDTFRYINWLHNGMPATGIQDSSTTENGAYKLLGANPRTVVRNAGAKFFLPDQDEWHKAAFFDPNPGQGRPRDSQTWLPGGSAHFSGLKSAAGCSFFGASR